MNAQRIQHCPRCDAEISYNPEESEVYCPDCKTKYYIEVDAEFVNGSWKDLTKLRRP